MRYPRDPVSATMAIRALEEAFVCHWDHAFNLLDEIEDLFGVDGARTACGVWCDTVIDKYTGHEPVTISGIDFIEATTGEALQADDMPQDKVWAGRLLVAWMADDHCNVEALLACLPAEPDDRNDYLRALLNCSAATLRRLYIENAANRAAVARWN